jgi:Protein of unknown function (DUF4238)
MAAQTSRKHHFIPVFFLQQWANKAGELVVWHRPHNEVISRWKPPTATGFEVDLNTFHGLPPTIRTYLEDEFLRSADDDASRALDKLLERNNTPWDSRLRSGWSRFLMTLPIRHPDVLEELKTLIKDILDGDSLEIQARYAAERTPDMPENYKDYLYSQNEGGQERIIVHFVQGVMDNHILGPHMNSLTWEVLDLSKSSYPLLLSDRPAHMMSVQNERALVMLPLTPQKLFVGFRSPRVFHTLRALDPNRVCKESNKFLVQRARRFVFSSDESQKA